MKSLSITSDQFPDAFAGRCPGIVVDVFWRVESGPNRPEVVYRRVVEHGLECVYIRE